MKKTIYGMKLIVAVMILAGLILPISTVSAEDVRYEPITIKLIELLDSEPKIKDMLTQSIEKAKEQNPDKITNFAQDYDSYLEYIDEASKLFPQQVLEDPSDLTREQILQSLCYFYFLIDQPLPELEGLGLFKPSLQYYGPFSKWTREFAVTWGDYLDTEESWNEKNFKQFENDPVFGLRVGWYESPSHWKTFNQFFAKHLKSPYERPIAYPYDASVVVSPADSVPQGTWPIDEKSNIQVKSKLVTYYSVNDLLAKDSKYKDAFANGTLTHTFLNVFDYHRYHFAVGGTVLEKRILQRNVALEVTWDEKEKKYDPVDSTGWQFTQTLGYVIVDTGAYGLVALIPMGMAQVSSVNLEPSVFVGSTHKKGDMLGNFFFGGSDFIMLFQEKAGFEIMVQKESDEDAYRHILMGTKYGVMTGQN